MTLRPRFLTGADMAGVKRNAKIKPEESKALKGGMTKRERRVRVLPVCIIFLLMRHGRGRE